MDTTCSLLVRQTIVREQERRDGYGLAKGGGKHLDQIPASRLATRLELLRNTLRPTPHVQLAMKGMDLFAKLEYVNPVGSIKDRAAYWILTRAAQRGEICEETTVIESSSGNFAAALAAFTHLVGLRFIAVDTEGSAIFGGAPRKRHIPGIGSSIVPQLLSHAKIDDVVVISERETVQACRELLTTHGLFVGGSSGTAFAAIKRYAARMPASKHPTVLFLCADRGTPYLDTVFDSTWATRLE